MIRKGPDGKTIRPSEIPAAPDAPTQKVPRRSIKDRLMAQGDPDEVPVTHMQGAPANPTPKAPPPAADPDLATVYASETPPRTKAPAIDAPTGPRGGPVTAAPPPIPAPPPQSAPPPPPAAEAATGEPPPTQIYRPANKPEPPGPAGVSPRTRTPSGPPALAADGTIGDPVVGWLVIVAGPGRGTSLSLGYGNNRIGRAPTENVSLDFGDEQISRENHATVTFDGRHRRFYVQQGGGRNLVYVNDEPVMVPIELKGGEELMLGETKLKFVAFCGKNFDWYAK